MSEILKPCPFCGSHSLIEHTGYPLNRWSIKCLECGGRMMIQGSREQVIAAWNRRARDE